MRDVLKIAVISLGILATAIVVRGEDPTPVPTKAKVTFPGVAPVPAAPVLPDAVSVLQANQLFVVTSDEPFVLIASPANLVTITRETGPLKVRSVFADGTGKLETRTYSAPHIFIVEAAGEGRVELIAIPNGFTDDGDLVRRWVDCGHAPQPPPGPDVDPVNPTPVTGFRVLMIYETSAKLTREQSNILNSTKIRGLLNQVCTKGSDGRAEWRCWDKDIEVGANESKPLVDLWNAVKPKLGELPKLVVAINGNATVMELPASEDATFEKLKSLAGVK